MKGKRLFAVLSLLYSLLSVQYVPAQDCQQNGITPDNYNNQTAYKLRSNRCEGLIRREVAGTHSFSIVSVTIGQLYFETRESEVIKVEVPRTRKFRDFPVVGTSFQHERNYRLDMVIGAGNHKEIPVREVILPIGFRPHQLGFYIKLPQEEDYFAPVTLISQTYKSVLRDSVLIIDVVAGINIKDVSCRYSVVENGICGKTILSSQLPKAYLKGAVIRLEISLNQIPGLLKSDVDMCVELNGKNKATGADMPTYQFKVFIPKKR